MKLRHRTRFDRQATLWDPVRSRSSWRRSLAIVVYLDTRDGEAVAVGRVIPRDA